MCCLASLQNLSAISQHPHLKKCVRSIRYDGNMLLDLSQSEWLDSLHWPIDTVASDQSFSISLENRYPDGRRNKHVSKPDLEKKKHLYNERELDWAWYTYTGLYKDTMELIKGRNHVHILCNAILDLPNLVSVIKEDVSKKTVTRWRPRLGELLPRVPDNIYHCCNDELHTGWTNSLMEMMGIIRPKIDVLELYDVDWSVFGIMK